MEITPLQSVSADDADDLYSIEVSESTAVKDSIYRKEITRQSTILAIGAVGIFASYSGVLGLQSTLNFEDSLGTTSLAICFATTILANLTFAPVLLERVGAKALVISADVTFVIFTLANIYPAKFTLYPAAVLLGIGEAFIWPAVTSFNSSFATATVSLTTSKTSKDECESAVRENVKKKLVWFSGRFYAVFSAYLVIGNMMAYSILRFDLSQNTQSATNFSDHARYECGALDCYEYDANIGNTTDNNMTISNDTLRYVLFAGYTFLQICCCVLHAKLLWNPNKLQHQEADVKPSSAIKIARHVFSSFCEQITNIKQVLIAPFNFYNGMMMAFIFGDFTRSYIACAMSVHQIGLLMTIFGLSSAITCRLFQLSSNHVSRHFCVGLALTTEAFVLLWCVLWRANEFDIWQIYVVSALLGVSDSIREAVITAIYPVYFHGEERAMAFNFLSMLNAAGLATMFAISTNICLIYKCIILSSLLASSILCYCILEIHYA